MKNWKSVAKIVLDRFILTPLKHMIPVRKVILFESFSDFTDSSRTVFLNMIDKDEYKNYDFIWFVDKPESFKNVNYKNVSFRKIHTSGWMRITDELRNFYLFSSCERFYYTHRSFARTRPKSNQTFINLTHGTSLKDTRGIHPPFKYNSYTTVTSDFTKNLRVISYSGGETQMKVTGLPRNDELFEGLTMGQKKSLNLGDYDKKLLWMPTFRRQKGKDRNDTGTSAGSDIPLISDDSDWDKLNAYLNEKNILLIIKPHPAQRMEYIRRIDFSHLKLVTNDDLEAKGILLYNLLGEMDGLVSDYSSVFIDFLILNKPIAFTVDDMKAYSDNLGFSVDNPLDFMSGEKIYGLDDLYGFLENINDGKDPWKTQREYIRNVFHIHKDSKATERVLNLTNM